MKNQNEKKILCSKKGVNFSLERAYLDRKKILSIISGKNFVEKEYSLQKPSRAETVCIGNESNSHYQLVVYLWLAHTCVCFESYFLLCKKYKECQFSNTLVLSRYDVLWSLFLNDVKIVFSLRNCFWQLTLKFTIIYYAEFKYRAS